MLLSGPVTIAGFSLDSDYETEGVSMNQCAAWIANKRKPVWGSLGAESQSFTPVSMAEGSEY